MNNRRGQVWEFFDEPVYAFTIIITASCEKCKPNHHDLESWKHQAYCLETRSFSTWWEPVDYPYETRNDRRCLA